MHVDIFGSLSPPTTTCSGGKRDETSEESDETMEVEDARQKQRERIESWERRIPGSGRIILWWSILVRKL